MSRDLNGSLTNYWRPISIQPSFRKFVKIKILEAIKAKKDFFTAKKNKKLTLKPSKAKRAQIRWIQRIFLKRFQTEVDFLTRPSHIYWRAVQHCTTIKHFGSQHKTRVGKKYLPFGQEFGLQLTKYWLPSHS